MCETEEGALLKHTESPAYYWYMLGKEPNVMVRCHHHHIRIMVVVAGGCCRGNQQ